MGKRDNDERRAFDEAAANFRKRHGADEAPAGDGYVRDFMAEVEKGRTRTKKEVELFNGEDIEPEAVSWLWPGWLQSGAFNLIAGKPTAGKSTIALSFCATVTAGSLWPDNQPNHGAGHALYWSGEDGIKNTLLPRFIAGGGKRSNITFVGGVREGQRKRPFDPARDMESLTLAAEKLRNLRLVVLDPIALMVKGDSHKNVETRVGLQPFVDLLTRTGACGLGVHHLTKNSAGGDPLDRVSGSLAFGALPRCVLLAARDLNGGENAKRALMKAKVSNDRDWGGLDYMLDRRPLEGWPTIQAQLVLWGAFIDRSARDVLGQYEGKPARHPAAQGRPVPGGGTRRRTETGGGPVRRGGRSRHHRAHAAPHLQGAWRRP
jgi:hypothetical protein